MYADFSVLCVCTLHVLSFHQVCSLSLWPRPHWSTCCAVSLSWPSPTTASCSLYYAILMKLIWRLWPRCLTLPEIPSEGTSVDSWGPDTGRKYMHLHLSPVFFLFILIMTLTFISNTPSRFMLYVYYTCMSAELFKSWYISLKTRTIIIISFFYGNLNNKW